MNKVTYFGSIPEVGKKQSSEIVTTQFTCNIFVCNFFFKRKKVDFRAFFSAFYGQHSVTAAWANPSPWSISEGATNF